MRIYFILFLLFVSTTSFAGKKRNGGKNDSKLNFTIGIRLSTIGRGESFVFSLGPGKQITINSNVLFNFPGSYPTGYKYKVKQVSGPRVCHFVPGTNGTVTNSNVEIACDGGVADDYALLNGVFKAPKGTVVELLNNGADRLRLLADIGPTPFSFPKAYMQGSTYNITVSAKPPGMTVTVIGSGGEPNTIFPGSFLTVTADYTYDLVSRSTKDSVLSTFYESSEPSICKSPEDDGRYIAFISSAKGLAGSSGKHRQIFWRDRLTGETKLVSKSADGEEGNGDSFSPVMAVSGYKIVFESYADNLVSGDRNKVRDIFLWSGSVQGFEKIERVSVGQGGVEANAESFEPCMSGMGNDIAFSSGASNLTEGVDGINTVNVYLRNQIAGTNTLISMDPVTQKGVGGSKPSIDMDGYKLAFYSFSDKLVADDKNNLWDIFLYRKGYPALKRITLTSSGGERNQGNESTSRVVAPTISGFGQYIAYATTSSNIVPGDNNGMQDVFLYNIQENITTRVSVNNNGEEGNGDSPIGQGERIALSANGEMMAFTTKATNFGVPENNLVLYSLVTREMKPVSFAKGTYVSTPSISRNGRYVVFGCGQPLDVRFRSSGLFVAFTGTSN